ncbi:CaiB/BaiF CoA transferase family protein [Salipiger mucosus]|uniref:CAIB/BAIF family protein n=1 Tax=Salipiger mucosus DSM 16094 TaxID=1123237 RepID=S9QZX2_9RHOB|nr:CoA transferase [Salipiger mucosus]EPX85233.1 CAIB/BAIF family protein [Salipiger mucosus DSM 16094]
MSWQKKTFDETAGGPMEGIRVVDLSRLVAGNMCSLQLADFGADVIKVEPLPTGDPLRAWKREGKSTFWTVYGRNKRSLGLDFRKEGAVELLKRLVAGADVLIESFRPGTLEKMGLGPEVLHELAPGLVILRVSGFGQTGPYSSRPGFGTLVEGMSGFASRNGEEGGDPLLPPLALADMIAGLYGSNAILMSLRSRETTGRGQVVDLGLLDAMTSVLGPEALDFQISHTPKPRLGNGSNTSSPRNVYQAKDGGYIALSASMQKTAERVFRCIGREDLIEHPDFCTNERRVARRAEVDKIVGDWVGARSTEEVLDIFDRNGITAAPVYDIADISEDPHFRERGIYVELPDEDLGGAPMHAPVPRLSATPGTFHRPAPHISEHARQILSDAGFDATEAAQLFESGLVGEHSE